MSKWIDPFLDPNHGHTINLPSESDDKREDTSWWDSPTDLPSVFSESRDVATFSDIVNMIPGFKRRSRVSKVIDAAIVIGVTTAVVGGYEYNQKLSVKRAKSAAQYLEANGVSPLRLQIHGFGYSDPVASNATRAGRYLNQRVEIVPVK